jgi:PAS domain S-box-containing protein
MDSFSSTVTLLILTSREDEAEGLIKSLRKGGLAVRGIFTSEPERMEELAASNPFDLILLCEYDPGVELDACMSHYRALEVDVPLVIIADASTESGILIEALRSGARDLTEHGDTDHLQLVVARELSDLGHRRSEDSLRERLEECIRRSRDLIDASGEAVAFIQEGIHLQVNPAYQELYGFDTLDQLEGMPLLDLIAADCQQEARESLRAVEQRGATEPADLNVRCIRADDELIEVRLNISRSNLDGEPCVRIRVRPQAAESVQSQSVMLDEDTGLPNRAALIEELGSRLARATLERRPFAAIYVGLSVFHKLLRDQGLTNGLRRAAELGAKLRDLAPPNAYLARVSDDGYVLLIWNLVRSDADALTARIRREARVPLARETVQEEGPQCGSGLLLADASTRSADDLLDTIYRDYVFSALPPAAHASPPESLGPTESAPSEAALLEERRLASRIDHALDIDGFELAYQPVVSLKGDSQESYDVLLRMREDDRTLLESKNFFAAAIHTGKIVAVDRWVIRNAVAAVAEQRANGHRVNIFVSVCEDTLREERLLIWICDCLRELRARGNWLTLQVQEEHARPHPAVFTRLSEGLKKVKCRVALNRFGEGPNPDLLLRSLRVDYVKFPPALGRGLADDKSKQRQLKELTKLTRDAGVRSVVTGVEDARTLTVLWTVGIDYVQGDFLQRPCAAMGKPR